jgi:hypothetical protein
MHEERTENGISSNGPFYEVLTAVELAARWRVPVTWIYEQTRERCPDPIPCVKLGKYRRFQWNSPELLAWWNRRKAGGRDTHR